MTGSKKNTVLDKYDLVTFFPGGWEIPWRGLYLIQALSDELPNSKILCVENPIDLVVSLIKHFPRLISRIRNGNVVSKVNENLYIYRPWIFLNVHIASKFLLIQKLNLKWIKFQLDKVVKGNNFRTNSLITWFTDPFQAGYLKVLDAKLKVFDCYDDYADTSHNYIFRTKRELLEKERKVLQKVDITFVVSELLYEDKRFNCNSLHIIPNAVDTKHFGRAIKQTTLIAEDILHIPHPIIGFLGNLDDRIDIFLLNWLAIRNKGWSFVLIGGKRNYMKNMQKLNSFEKNSNVYLLGNKPYEDLPMYLKAFDVCMIPFREDDPFSLSCSPLKLYEYLATGRPIVSTNLPGVSHFNSFIRIAGSKEAFEQHIKEALQEKLELHEKRVKTSEVHSWNKRAEEVIRILETIVNSQIN